MGTLKRALILDTSAVLSGLPLPADAPLLTTPRIEEELRPGGPAWRRLESLRAAGLQVRVPGPESRARAREAAERTGDAARLSPADLELLALAVEMGAGGLLVTDDYSLQNVARHLGLGFQPVVAPGIREEFAWRLRCTGCGRWFDAPPKGEVCPVCGSALKTKRTRNAPA